MSSGAVSGDRYQQARDNVAARRQSGLEPRWEDLRDAGLLKDEETQEREETKD